MGDKSSVFFIYFSAQCPREDLCHTPGFSVYSQWEEEGEHPALPWGEISGTRIQGAEPKPPAGERVAAEILTWGDNSQIAGVGRPGSSGAL